MVLWKKLRREDLHLRPSGYEPDKLTTANTPQKEKSMSNHLIQITGTIWLIVYLRIFRLMLPYS